MKVFPLILFMLVSCLDVDHVQDQNNNDPIAITVPAGATPNSMASKLIAHGFAPDKLRYKVAIRDLNTTCLKAGNFRITRSMSLRAVFDTLCGAPIANDVPFKVLEGWRIVEIDAALAKANLIQPGEYASLATSKNVDVPFDITSPTLEGYLYPETYMVSPEAFSSKAFIERQLDHFNDKFLRLHPNDFETRTLSDIVIMASMLEREEPRPNQRRVIAGILWKRLDNAWALGVDATSRYKLTTWNDRSAFLKMLRDKSDLYNTRLRQGLPPTAIGSPSLSSLEAALLPIESPYWFYLHDKNGTFHGGVDGREHEANRAKYNVY